MRNRNRRFSLSVSALLTLLLLIAACGGPATPENASSTEAPAAAAEPGTQDGASALDASSRTLEAPGAVFELPGDWQSEPPASSMRLAQARIPGKAGPGELTVFHFGAGGGGDIEDNLNRWAGQVDSDTEPERGELSAESGFKIHWLDVAGTLKPSGMGMGPNVPIPGARLLGGVVEGPGGPWFFKATGPTDTLAEQREAFLAMLRSGRPK